MRHAKKKLQLNRFTSWNEATIRSLARNLLVYQSIKTSLVKAKAAKPLAEKLITLAKRNTLSARRQAFEVLGDHKLVSLLFNDIGPRFQKVPSGFTRVIPLGARRGDNAQIAIFELTEIKKKEVKKPKKEAKEALKPEEAKEKPPEEARPRIETAVKEEKHPELKKQPKKKFLGGIRGIFKKERDSL